MCFKVSRSAYYYVKCREIVFEFNSRAYYESGASTVHYPIRLIEDGTRPIPLDSLWIIVITLSICPPCIPSLSFRRSIMPKQERVIARKKACMTCDVGLGEIGWRRKWLSKVHTLSARVRHETDCSDRSYITYKITNWQTHTLYITSLIRIYICSRTREHTAPVESAGIRRIRYRSCQKQACDFFPPLYTASRSFDFPDELPIAALTCMRVRV